MSEQPDLQKTEGEQVGVRAQKTSHVLLSKACLREEGSLYSIDSKSNGETSLLSQVTIREALQELAAWSQTSELKLVDHEENGRRTAIIKDWANVFLELGDKQSLLASLRESQFFKAFEDQGITYEVEVLRFCFPCNSFQLRILLLIKDGRSHNRRHAERPLQSKRQFTN